MCWLVKLAIEGFGPEMMQAEVHVSSVNISTGDGQRRLSGLNLGNPRGFKTDHALKADTIEIMIEPASITSKPIWEGAGQKKKDDKGESKKMISRCVNGDKEFAGEMIGKK